MSRRLWSKNVIIFSLLMGVLALGMSPAAEGREYGPSEIRLGLMKAAMEEVGVCSPEEAVRVWSKGIVDRSAALQYAVMTLALREKYADALETSAPDWVTGVSSPWVVEYSVNQMQITAAGDHIFGLEYRTLSSAGPDRDYAVRLYVTEERGFWRIAGILHGEEFGAYTGFPGGLQTGPRR